MTLAQPGWHPRFGLVFLLVCLSVTSYFQRTSISIAGPGMAREFGLTETQLGSIYSAFLLGYTLLMIPGGWLADRLGARNVLGLVAVATAGFTAGTAIVGLDPLGGTPAALVLLVIIRCALGVSAAPLYPAAARMNSNRIPVENRALVQGWIAAGAGIGGALSPFLFPLIIAGWGWRFAFAVTGAATLVVALSWFLVTRIEAPLSGLTQAQSRLKAPWKSLLSNRQLILITLSYFLTCYFEYIFFYWTYYYLGEIRHASASQSAIFTSILFLAWTVLAPVGGLVSDSLSTRRGLQHGRRLTPILGLVLSAVVTIIGVELTNTTTSALMLALGLGFAAATDASFWAAAIEVGGRQSGAAGGILNTGGNLGGLIAPVLTPWLAARYGWSWGFYFGCFIVLVGASLWLVIKPVNAALDKSFELEKLDHL
jgi:ACS family glucarate transporter-like MFS transporter